MKTVGIRELKSKATSILRSVQESGETVSVTIRGQEVARIVPARRHGTADELEAFQRRMDELRDRIAPLWPEGISAVDAVREQRRDL